MPALGLGAEGLWLDHLASAAIAVLQGCPTTPLIMLQSKERDGWWSSKS